MKKDKGRGFKVKKNKIVFVDKENPQNEKLKVDRRRDWDGDVKITLSAEDGPKLFWLNDAQIQKMIDTLEQARDSAMYSKQ